jgi:hypothetical protein
LVAVAYEHRWIDPTAWLRLATQTRLVQYVECAPCDDDDDINELLSTLLMSTATWLRLATLTRHDDDGDAVRSPKVPGIDEVRVWTPLD